MSFEHAQQSGEIRRDFPARTMACQFVDNVMSQIRCMVYFPDLMECDPFTHTNVTLLMEGIAARQGQDHTATPASGDAPGQPKWEQAQMNKGYIKATLVYLGAAATLMLLATCAYLYASASQGQIAAAKKQASDLTTDTAHLARVKTCTVFTQPFVDVLRLPATVEAYQDIDLAVKRGGIIRSITLHEGDAVKKGQTLLQLDNTDLKAELQRAETGRDLAQVKFDRNEVVAQNERHLKGAI